MDSKKRKIVVMGGSFNPPTLAHHQLMKEAIDSLDAHRGVFVPVSDAYLKRKMRHSHPPIVLSPEVRINMLRAMCTDNRMYVCEKEIGTIEPNTLPTLFSLQDENPGAELYFLMGADKLNLLEQLTLKRDFLKHFGVVLYARDGWNIVEMLNKYEVLKKYSARITVLSLPKGIDSISSTKVRERMLAGKSCQDLLCQGVWDLLKDYSPAEFPDVIRRFTGEYAFLSNRFACRFVWEGLGYTNAEAAFQSSKYAEIPKRKAFGNCSGDKAALIGRNLVPPSNWEDSRLRIMESILSAKFEQNPELMSMLLETGNSILVYGNNRRDTYWGIDLYSWKGENHLGKLLTKIRNKETKK